MKFIFKAFGVLFWGLALFKGCLFPLHLMGQLAPEMIFEQANPAVVELGNGNARATGFFIQENLIVTCYHVVRGVRDIKGYIGQDSFEITGWRALDSVSDIAVIEANFKSPFILKLQSELPKVGNPVYVIGSSLGRTNTFSNGIVSKVTNLEEGIQQIQFTAPSSFGNSGGPLLDAHGMVLGVVSKGSWLVGQNINFATASVELEGILQSLSPQARLFPEEIEVEGEDDQLLASLNFKRFRFGDYTVELPSEWDIVDGKGSGGTVFAAYSPQEHSEDVYKENVALYQGTGLFEGKKVALLSYVANSKKNVAEFNLIEMNYEGELPYVHYSGIAQGIIPFSVLAILYNVKPNNYMLEFGFEGPEAFKRYRLVFNRIIKTLERR